MTQPDAGPGRRLYGMMQGLMVLAAHQEIPEAGVDLQRNRNARLAGSG